MTIVIIVKPRSRRDPVRCPRAAFNGPVAARARETIGDGDGTQSGLRAGVLFGYGCREVRREVLEIAGMAERGGDSSQVGPDVVPETGPALVPEVDDAVADRSGPHHDRGGV
jgi:hypothetical protein